MNSILDHIFETYDKNNDGWLNKNEAKKFLFEYMKLIGYKGEINDGVFRNFFDRYDSDATGTITRDEMRVFLKTLNNKGKWSWEQSEIWN